MGGGGGMVMCTGNKKRGFDAPFFIVFLTESDEMRVDLEQVDNPG